MAKHPHDAQVRAGRRITARLSQFARDINKFRDKEFHNLELGDDDKLRDLAEGFELIATKYYYQYGGPTEDATVAKVTKKHGT